MLNDQNLEGEFSKPLVSVITSVLNGVESIEETIKSVLNQSYKNIEYIIIDGGSTDGTDKIIKKYQNKIHKWISEPDTGVYNAWNKGINLASGDWIAFLGSDDLYLENALSNYVNFINSNKNKEYEHISSRVRLIKNNKILRSIGKPWKWPDFQKNMSIAHVGSFHNKKIYERYGFYNEDYKICGDYELLLRAGPRLKSGFIEFETVAMSAGGISDSQNSIYEMEKVKVETGNRGFVISKIERIIGVLKYKIRKLIWY